MYIQSISALPTHKILNFQNRTGTPVKTEKFQAVVPNILSYEESFFQSSSGVGDQNPAFSVDVKASKINPNKLNYKVNVNKLNNPAVLISKDKTAYNLPEARLKTGKFGPTIELVDSELGITIQMLADSKANISDKLTVIVPKQTGESQFGINKNISFSGNYNSNAKLGGGEVQVVTFYNEHSTKEAVDLYTNDKNKLYNQVLKGDYIDEFQENKPNVMILAGGFGTRLYNLTGSDSNKPALSLPTNNNYRLMANALDLASKSGMITDNKDNLVYLSGAGTIDGDNVREVLQNVNLGDGGCIAKALFNEKTATDKPLIILNADTFTNADITRAYKAYLDHPDAALLIPFYEASEARAKGFGLISIDNDCVNDDEVYEIKSFIEKPKNPREDAKNAIVANTLETGEPKFMANPGIYIISPEALKVLKAKGDGINKELGLAKNFVTPLVEACINGDFFNENGEPMKCYTTKLEKKGGDAAYWDDLGLDIAIPQTFRDMAKETKLNDISIKNKYFGMPEFLLNDAVKNTDLESGLVYMNDEARVKYDQFMQKYPGFSAKGNILVYDYVK